MRVPSVEPPLSGTHIARTLFGGRPETGVVLRCSRETSVRGLHPVRDLLELCGFLQAPLLW